MNSPILIPLLNDSDQIIGYEEKMRVHELGLLHRAFSILIYNKKGEMLIHQRALEKYHSPGLWTNACCGHPNQNESMEAAVKRRLQEEMGFTCELKYSFVFRYRATFDNGLIENEIDHVYVGVYDEEFIPNPEEVADFKWLTLDFLRNDAKQNPEKYTYWFKEILGKL
jgi:isopentenyl-diphosphate Delta-isomerase